MSVDEGRDNRPPHDHDLTAEVSVLSAMMLDGEALAAMRVAVQAEHFYAPANRRIFEACLALDDAGEPVDAVTVAGWLKARGRFADVGGASYLARVIDQAPEVAHLDSYAAIVRESAQVRLVEATLGRLLRRCRGQVGDRVALLTEARAAVEAVTEGVARAGQGLPVVDVSTIPAEMPPPAFVSERLAIGPGRPACVVGYAGAGKTLLAADFALAVAAPEGAGVTFWGGLVPDRRGKVLLLDFEVGEYLTKQRLTRLAAGRWGSLAQWAGRLSFSCFPRWSLVSPGAEERLKATLQGHVLCVIDSLAAITPGVDENGKEMADHMALLTRVSESTGCAILVLHHEGKPPQDGPRAAHLRGRGSSAIQGIWSSQWAVTSLGEGRLQLEHGKTQWDGGLRPSHVCQICDVHDDEGRRVGVRLAPVGPSSPAQAGGEPGAPPIPAGALARVKAAARAALEVTPGLSSKELHEEIKRRVKAATDTRFQAVDELVKEGTVSVGREGKALVYRLVASITSPSGNRSADDARGGSDDDRLPLDSLPAR